MSHPQLSALVIDDERPTLDEIAFLLRQDPRVGDILTCDSAAEGLRVLHEHEIDVVFLDIQMPGLTGLDMAQVLSQFRAPPAVVFVTAHENHAVEAFDLSAVDYVLKPVREERLAEAVRRVGERVGAAPSAPTAAQEQIAVERGGVTRFVNRSDILYVEAQGDYARLHTDQDTHLVRSPLTTLERQWADAGFLRIHRSLLVSLAHVRELRTEAGKCSVVVGSRVLQVSRRHTPQLREVLARRGRP